VKPRTLSSLHRLEIKQLEEEEIAKFNLKVERETRALDERISHLTAKFENAQSKMVHCSLLKGGELFT